MNYNALISVIIPAYNAEKFLHETINSLLMQTHTNWECIIVDDGSTDNTKKIAEEFVSKDERIKYLFQNNSGPSFARNVGVRSSNGEYIQFLDSDDVIMPSRFELLLNEYAKLESQVILYTDMLVGTHKDIYRTEKFRFYISTGSDIGFKDMYDKFAKDFLFIPSCLLLPVESVKGIDWDISLSYAEDWDYYLKILDSRYIFRFYDKPLVIYRDTLNSLSKNTIETYKANYRILYKWKNKTNNMSYYMRCSFLFHRNIILYFQKRVSRVLFPNIYDKFIIQRIYKTFIILVLTFTLISRDILTHIQKKLK